MSSKDPEDAQDAEGRAPYEKPAVAWEEAMDVRPNLMALCGKLGGGGDACNAAPTS